MERTGSAGQILAAMGLAMLLVLLVAATAEAKFPEGSDPEPPAGITVAGIGFAPTNSDAVDRAVRDAQRRAEVIARELKLGLGAIEGVELPEVTQFRAFQCRRDKRASLGCQSPPTAVAAIVTFGIAGGAIGESAGQSVRAVGGASAPVVPKDRNRSRTIKRAVLAARRAVTQEAAASVWRTARMAASAAGLDLGRVVSVSETTPYYYGPSFYDAALGTFGSGRFCGITRRPVVQRDPDTGATRVVRRVPRRSCFFPSPYSVHLEINYEAG